MAALILSSAAVGEPVRVIAVEPQVTPIGHTAQVTLTLNQAADIDSVSLAPGGADLRETHEFETAITRAATGSQSTFVLHEDGSASTIVPETGGLQVDALLPAATLDPNALVAFDGRTAVAVNAKGELVIGDLATKRWMRSNLSWDSTETLQDLAVDNGFCIVATTHSLLGLNISGAAEDAVERIAFDEPLQSIAMSFPLVVVGFERHIVVYLVGDDKSLVRQGSVDATHKIADVGVSNQIAAAALGEGGIMLVDVGDPQQPLWLSRYGNIGDVQSIQLTDNKLMAIERSGRHLVFDISNATAPVVTHAIRGREQALGVGLNEDAAWLVDKQKLALWDIRYSEPRLSNADLDAGQGVNYGGQRRAFFDASTKRLFVADWFSGMHIYDVSEPKRPRLLSTFHTPGSSKGVTVRDNLAYVADDDHGLQIVDVADPTAPKLAAALALTGLAYTPVLDGDRLFMASHHGGFQIIDIANPFDPKLIGSYDTPGKAWSLALAQNVLIVADSEGGLIGFNIANPEHPEPVWEFNPGGHAEDVVVDGTLAFVAFFDGSVYSVDVSDPMQPKVLGQGRTPGNARGLAKRGNVLYVANWLAGVVAMDVSDAEDLRLGDRLDTDGATWGVSLGGDGELFALDWWGGLVVLGERDDSGLFVIGRYNQFGAVNDLAVMDNYLITAEGDFGVQIYDINNPLNPTWAAGLELGHAAKHLAIADRRAFIATDGNRIEEVDLSSPFNPLGIGLIKTDEEVSRIKADGNAVAYLASGQTLCAFDARAADPPRCHRFDGGVADFDVSRGTVIAATANRVWRWTLDGYPDQIDATFAVDGPTRFVRAHPQGIRVINQDYRIGRYDDTTKSYEPGDMPHEVGQAHDVALDGDRVAFATEEGVRIVEITPDGGAASTRYDAARSITGLATHNGVIYGASARSIFAVDPLDAVTWSKLVDDQVLVDVPPDLPEGSYHVVARIGGNAVVFANTVRRQLKGFAKPDITLEELNKFREQQRESDDTTTPNAAPRPD